MDKQTVLIIDDEPSNLILLSSLLLPKYVVKVASSGSHGIRLALCANPPKLILLDVLMPEPDGFEVCKVLKENRKTRAIPVVFLTNLGLDEDRKLGFAMGAAEYLMKPVSAATLIATIQKHLAPVQC